MIKTGVPLRPRYSARTCEVNGCLGPAKFNRPICMGHWNALPVPVRARLSRALQAGDVQAIAEAKTALVVAANRRFTRDT